jgi:hypothetical protein
VNNQVSYPYKTTCKIIGLSPRHGASSGSWRYGLQYGG